MDEISIPQEREFRLAKVNELRQRGNEPYPARCTRGTPLFEIRRDLDRLSAENALVHSVGRVIAIRHHGKSTFAHIYDGSDKFQVYFRMDNLGQERYDVVKRLLDIGDFIELSGTLFRTHTNEATILVQDFRIVTKALRPLPEKWHGLQDEDKRLRQRYLDVILNQDVRNRFVERGKIIGEMRKFMDSLGYLEVDTPVLQPLYGGANARPFETYVHALDTKFYLRIATELYLKRLIIAGYEKVYELGKDFRNEGIDRMHNPEFTVMEMYQAYADYNDMMELAQNLLRHLALQVKGTLEVTYQGVRTSLADDFPKVSFWQAICEHTGRDFSSASREEIVAYLKSESIEFASNLEKMQLVDEIFKEKVEKKLVSPTFVVDYPVELSPLAKRKPGSQSLVERFELFWYGMEIANAFTELNDPVDQRKRFEEQMERRAKGDVEAQVLDEDFLIALEHGMPPTGGMGIGVDRLVMILTDAYSIRDVIFFPLLKPLDKIQKQE